LYPFQSPLRNAESTLVLKIKYFNWISDKIRS